MQKMDEFEKDAVLLKTATKNKKSILKSVCEWTQ